MIKQASLSGIANRYIDLKLGPANGDEIENGGTIGPDQTATAVELDQIFNLFDQRTRTGLQDFFKGSAAMLHGKGKELRRGVHYLNPAFSTGARLFKELTRDDALLERFLVDSGTLVNALADRREDLTGVVRQPERDVRRARAPAVRARGVGGAAPAVHAPGEHDVREPARRARRRRPVRGRREARGAPARPVPGAGARCSRATARRPSATCRARSPRPGSNNDLIELIKSFPPLAQAALDTRQSQRRRPARRLPGDDRRAQGRRAHDRLRPPLHAGLRRLDGRLLHHRRLRRARRLLARLDQPLRDPLRRRARSRSSTAAARARTSSPPPTAATCSPAMQAAALECDPNQRSVGP